MIDENEFRRTIDAITSLSLATSREYSTVLKPWVSVDEEVGGDTIYLLLSMLRRFVFERREMKLLDYPAYKMVLEISKLDPWRSVIEQPTDKTLKVRDDLTDEQREAIFGATLA